MDYRQVERLMRIFSTVLAPTMVAGCQPLGPVEPVEPEVIDHDRFTEDLCGDGAQMQILDAVEPAEAVDYLELRHAEYLGFIDEGERDPDKWSVSTADRSGERCANASDPSTCNDTFDALPLESEYVSWGWDTELHRSIALTRGDEVAVVASRSNLLDLLGPIDAPGDAALLATMEGHRLVCGSDNDVGAHEDGHVLHTRSGGGCGEGDDIEEHVVLVRPNGAIEVIQTVIVEEGDPSCAIGRLPAQLCRTRRRSGAIDPVGTFFAEVAHLEGAAVTAFEQLATELTVHGAPRSMVRAALRSRRDEIRHARTTARLARRYGGRPVAPRVGAWAPRSLAEVAGDNAAEGCIRETYGALVAHAQARQAQDPIVRRALGRIAADETRHAALSWTLARWAEARMSPTQRRRVARQTRHALDRLELELTEAVDPRVHRVAGMPAPAQARTLYRGLRRALFAEIPA